MHLDVIEKKTINEMAEACFVSKAKISHFCKALGYDNFIAFKEDCSKENLDIDFHDHLHRTFQIMEMQLSKVNQHQIDELVKDIQRAEYVYLYGMAYSHLLCHYVQYEFDFLDKEVIILDEKLINDPVMKEGAMLIVLSIEGHALDNSWRILRQLQKYSMNKWIIATDMTKKDSLVYFDHCLLVDSEGSDMKERRRVIRYQYLNM